jgi:hypothetical protein
VLQPDSGGDCQRGISTEQYQKTRRNEDVLSKTATKIENAAINLEKSAVDKATEFAHSTAQVIENAASDAVSTVMGLLNDDSQSDFAYTPTPIAGSPGSGVTGSQSKGSTSTPVAPKIPSLPPWYSK